MLLIHIEDKCGYIVSGEMFFRAFFTLSLALPWPAVISWCTWTVFSQINRYTRRKGITNKSGIWKCGAATPDWFISASGEATEASELHSCTFTFRPCINCSAVKEYYADDLRPCHGNKVTSDAFLSSTQNTDSADVWVCTKLMAQPVRLTSRCLRSCTRMRWNGRLYLDTC